MSLAFLIPAALAALAALLIPLLIHLARRSEQRPTQFAALRWLRQKPKPRHRIRFDEWPLLIVRLLLIALMAALLARPVLRGGESHAPYVAVVPGVASAQLRDVAGAPEARWHWLAPGFPSIETKPTASTASVTSLLRELDANLPADVALTVVVPERLQGADGQRVVLSRPVDWRVVAGAMPDGAAPPASPPPVLLVRHAASNALSVRYLRAASAAWRKSGMPPVAPDAAGIEQPWPATARHLAWLAPGAVPGNVRDWTRAGGTLLLDAKAAFADAPPMAPLWRDASGEVLIEGGAYGRGRVLRFTRELVPQAMPQLLDPDFPTHLRAAFEPPLAPPTRVLAAGHAPTVGAASFPIAPRDLQPWLALAIALLFLGERWLATRPRGSVSP